MSSLQYAPVNLVRTQHRPQTTRHERPGLTARLALDRKTRNDAFGLRHASYLAGGFIDPYPSGLFSDSHDEMPNSQSIVVYQGSRPVASARICVLDTDPDVTGWSDIPAQRIFPEDVAALLAEHANGINPPKALEINRLVRHPDFASDFTLVFVLYRLAGFMILKHDANVVLSCVRRNHTPFYQRLQFNKVAGPRRYAGVKFETNLMVCPREKYGYVAQNLPVFEAMSVDSGNYDRLLRGDTVNVFGSKQDA
jgi:hypothetical protein